MDKKCTGCGITLQNTDSKALGYVPDLSMDMCQRCFRILHYDAHDKEIEFFDNNKILADLDKLEGTYIWIIDIFDLENSLHSDLVEFFTEKECIIICNKMDLLPKSFNFTNFKKKLNNRLKSLKIKYQSILYRGLDEDFFALFKFKVIENVADNVYIFTGCANVGKSTVINSLLDHDLLTVNRYPATSIDIHPVSTEVGDFVDTVGLVNKDNIVSYLSTSQLKKVVPNTAIRVKNYQIKEPQSLIIGGLAKIDIYTNQESSVLVYCSNLLNQHRGKIEKSNEYFKREYNHELKPTVGQYSELFTKTINSDGQPFDICINGLGFFSFYGPIEKICVTVNNKINIYVREVLL